MVISDSLRVWFQSLIYPWSLTNSSAIAAGGKFWKKKELPSSCFYSLMRSSHACPPNVVALDGCLLDGDTACVGSVEAWWRCWSEFARDYQYCLVRNEKPRFDPVIGQAFCLISLVFSAVIEYVCYKTIWYLMCKLQEQCLYMALSCLPTCSLGINAGEACPKYRHFVLYITINLCMDAICTSPL